MKRFIPFFAAVAIITGLYSCEKEFSQENGDNVSADNIIGADCRIAKITYADSASGVGTGSVAAIISSLDKVTDVTTFDSLTATIDYKSIPVYSVDTLYIDADQYYISDPVTKRITQFHGLVDPTNPFSLQFDVVYSYNASGLLINKSSSLTIFPGFPVLNVDYLYNSAGNMIHMAETDLTAGGDLVTDADVTYYNTIAPKNYIYIFPDEVTNAPYTQFLNFGKQPANAVKDLKVRFYDPGNVLRDSAVSSFKTYTKSLDNYITSVIMTGDDQPSIPAEAGKLKFSYHCK